MKSKSIFLIQAAPKKKYERLQVERMTDKIEDTANNSSSEALDTEKYLTG